jgi:hypothetical protein
MELNHMKCVNLWADPTKKSQMNIVRSWREQKIMLKRRFPILNDEDFVYEEGNKESMLKRLQAKLNKSASELESLFAELQLY